LSFIDLYFILALVFLWAIRLTVYLFMRHHRTGREDVRYAAMRTYHGARFKRYSLFSIFLLQALIQWILAIPLMLGVLWMDAHSSIFMLIGGGIFLCGFLVESIADYQMMRFKRQTHTTPALLTTGLFSLCRHPNYLGEMMVWFGIALVLYGASSSTSQVLVFLMPLAMVFLLIKVSGLPLLEAHLEKTRPDYAAYKAKVPALLPRFF
jgi:steroid 5-alpha reductase family enzyme